MIGTIDTNIWIYSFDRKSPEYKNTRKWIENNLSQYTLKTSIIIPLEIIHNLTKDPRVDFEIPFSYVNDILSLDCNEIIDLNLINFRGIANDLALLRNLGIGGRDTAILSVLDEGDTVITHDKNLLMLASFKRIDPCFNPPLILEVDEKLNAKEYKELLKQLEDK